jgi:hypothetical protein
MENMKKQLDETYKIDISDKIYVVNELTERILDFQNDPLKQNDTASYEKYFIQLLNQADTIKEIEKIIALSECNSGESFSCAEYVFIITKNLCICRSQWSGDGTVRTRIIKLNIIEEFIKSEKSRKLVPSRKFRKYVNASNSYDLYEITKKSIYANRRYTTPEDSLLNELTLQVNRLD